MSSASTRRILVVAPHADDETLGCGGTIARRAAEGCEVHVAVVTGHGATPHPLWPASLWDRIRGEARRAVEVLGVHRLHFEEVPAALVADQPVWQLNKAIGALVESIQPDVLYAPFPFDLHKDHREVFHALSVAWRTSSPTGRKLRAVYCYEVPSETHWNAPYLEAGFLPNVWVEISAHLETKLRALACYESQIRPAPDARSIDAVRALAVWRGSQQAMAAAEAFVAIRLLE
ncbi:MAG: PIG-L family deacetylase [Deltaproteobacteria bacterium]|nr:MAG: PIG-L family deacetylase [Deltaproteobacteria bacterium]